MVRLRFLCSLLLGGVLWVGSVTSPVSASSQDIVRGEKVLAPANEDAAVIVYGASWCGPCKTLKEKLDEKGIPYQYVDIEKYPEAYKRAKSLSGSNAIPLTGVVRNDTTTWVVGADPDTIERLYRG